MRLDKLLAERGLTPSRERAQSLILAGRVLVNEQKVEKAGAPVATDADVRILGDDLPYVSRGGLKLQRALEHWGINVQGHVCLDIGASTGGFTDCLLQHGAEQVIAVDTGYGQIDARLRRDPRVLLREKTNARYLTAEDLWPEPEQAVPISLVTMDVSFISATIVLPAVIHTLQQLFPSVPFELICLVKPQFEVGRKLVGKGGIVRDAGAQQMAVEKVKQAVESLGGGDIDVIDSPILGAEGNREFLLRARFA